METMIYFCIGILFSLSVLSWFGAKILLNEIESIKKRLFVIEDKQKDEEKLKAYRTPEGLYRRKRNE